MTELVKNFANDLCGWASDFPVFQGASVDEVIGSLGAYIRDASPEQFRAWKSYIKPLQSQCNGVLAIAPRAAKYGALLEYLMPESSKRVDAVLLISGAVLVVELKGDGNYQPEYVEQAADYARRLYWYHSLCGEEQVRVHSLLVSYGEVLPDRSREFHTLTHLSRLREAVIRFDRPNEAEPIPVEQFIAPEVCQPAPSLVQAARRFFANNALPRIKRIDDVTRGAVSRVVTEIHDAHQNKRRKLILVSGVPGAGKTFVGLQIAHEAFLDDLAEVNASGAKPTSPAVFLSGNGPLVDVLQYELKRAGGDGRVFVRGVKEFVERYSKKKSGPPPHHVLIFDEAQRAWDTHKVRTKHKDTTAVSEPETFVRFAEKVPGWSVVMGLIGIGQEIHSGEEGGVGLWAEAVNNSSFEWEVVAPESFRSVFAGTKAKFNGYDELHLAKSVRFHFAAGLSDWAAGVVSDTVPVSMLAKLARDLTHEGYQIRITRSLDRARQFLWEKYRHAPDARFGLLASSRDKNLELTGVDASRFLRTGPWYAEPENSPSSCRRLQEAITEFSAQGLELDHTLVVWGNDFLKNAGDWDASQAKQYQKKSAVKDPLQLRRNAYRVLLTRGREGMILCLPSIIADLDETYAFLVAAGCEQLE